MSIKYNFFKVFLFLSLLWTVFLLQSGGVIDTGRFAVNRDNGIISIFTAVFLHGNYDHISSNTGILLFTMPILLNLYKKESTDIMFIGLFLPSTICYILDMKTIGISGLGFAILWFLVLAGFTSRNTIKLIIAFLLSIFFSKMLILGITPAVGFGIAWQAHLGGFITAVAVVMYKRLFT